VVLPTIPLLTLAHLLTNSNPLPFPLIPLPMPPSAFQPLHHLELLLPHLPSLLPAPPLPPRPALLSLPSLLRLSRETLPTRATRVTTRRKKRSEGRMSRCSTVQLSPTRDRPLPYRRFPLLILLAELVRRPEANPISEGSSSSRMEARNGEELQHSRGENLDLMASHTQMDPSLR
jgi:hypothetical protein